MSQVKIVGDIKFQVRVEDFIRQNGDDFTNLQKANVERVYGFSGQSGGGQTKEEYITIWQDGWSPEMNNQHFKPLPKA